MLTITSKNEIRLTRGDTARLKVTINYDGTDSRYLPSTSDTLTLTVRKKETDANIVLQKIVPASENIRLAPEDTAALDFGAYKYDVQLNTAAGDVYTVIEPSAFTLAKEVTY